MNASQILVEHIDSPPARAAAATSVPAIYYPLASLHPPAARPRLNSDGIARDYGLTRLRHGPIPPAPAASAASPSAVD